MSPQLLIRDSRDSDMEAITKIYAEAVMSSSGTFEIDPPDLKEMKTRRENIMKGGYPYIIGEVNGKIAGYAYASCYRARPGYRFSVENSIYVAPEFQRQKIATRLLEELIKRCEQSDFRLMIAVIGDSSNTASIRTHKAAGFEHSGTLPAVGWKFNRWIDTVFMTRALAAGDKKPPKSAA